MEIVWKQNPYHHTPQANSKNGITNIVLFKRANPK